MSNSNLVLCHRDPQDFVRIRTSVYPTSRKSGKVVKTTQALDTAPVVCGCSISSLGGSSCSAHCLNRDRHVECIQVFCNCGQECLNQRIRKGLHAKTSVFDAGLKGRGLRAAEDLEVGKLVAEYVGEVISADEAAKRCDEYEEQRIKHMYLFQTRNGALIDATRKGNDARFINHSCKPNCQAQYWTVEGRECVGIFTVQTIKAGDEITYDYHSICAGEPVITCLCGSAECRGFLDSAMPGQTTHHRKRAFSAMVGEELRARPGFGDAPRSSQDQAVTMSTEKATSLHARQPSRGAISKSSSKRSCPAKSCSHSSIKAGSSNATHSASRGSARASAGGPAKSATTHSSKAAGQSRAEDGTISVLSLKGSWAGTAVRTAAVSKKQRTDRRHAWGFSLADYAAIPVSNKALTQTSAAGPTEVPVLQDKTAVTCVGNEQPQPPLALPPADLSTSGRAPFQSMVTRQAAAQAAGRSSASQGANALPGRSTHRPAFYKGLQDLLHRLDPQEAQQQLLPNAYSLQADIASLVGIDVSMARCRALVKLTMLPAFRGCNRLHATSQQVEHAQQAINAQQAVTGQQARPSQQAVMPLLPLPLLPMLTQQPSNGQIPMPVQQANPAQHDALSLPVARAQHFTPSSQAMPAQWVVSAPHHALLAPIQAPAPAQQQAHAEAAQQVFQALQVACSSQPAKSGQHAASAFPAKKARLSPSFEQRTAHVSMRARLANARDMPVSPTRRQAHATLPQHANPVTTDSALMPAPSPSSGSTASAAQEQGFQATVPEQSRSAAVTVAPTLQGKAAGRAVPLAPPICEQQSGQALTVATRQQAAWPTAPAKVSAPVTDVATPATLQVGKAVDSIAHVHQPAVTTFDQASASAQCQAKASAASTTSQHHGRHCAAANQSRQSGAPANPTANLPGGGSSSSISVAPDASGTANAPTGVRRSAAAGTSAGAGKSSASTVVAPQAATELSQRVDSSRHAEAAQAMPPPPERSSLQLPQAAVARQQGAAARPCSSHMPPPPPRPSTALQPGATADAAGSSSESDIDVDIELDDSSSPETDHVTAWIARQRRCPEPFLSAADYARRAGRRPNRAAAAAAPVAAAPAAAAPVAAATAPAHPGQASSLTQAAAAAVQNMLAPACTSPSTRESLPAAAEGSESASQCLPAAGQAPVLPRSDMKNSRHGVKPPLYPARRVKSPDGTCSSTLQASAGHAAGTAACPTPSIVNDPSYTAAEPGIAPTQGAPDKPDATVDATPPSTYEHIGPTADVVVASCTDVDEGRVPGAHPHALIPVAPAASPAAFSAQCVHCHPAKPCDM
ncbi:TPA: Histone-lysine N-methyltransferase setd2 [Trebouxia sp. C0004]